MNGTNWEALFWSLMEELEKIDDEVVIDIWERYEIAAIELEQE
jgi:uncharacterized protein YuzE